MQILKTVQPSCLKWRKYGSVACVPRDMDKHHTGRLTSRRPCSVPLCEAYLKLIHHRKKQFYRVQAMSNNPPDKVIHLLSACISEHISPCFKFSLFILISSRWQADQSCTETLGMSKEACQSRTDASAFSLALMSTFPICQKLFRSPCSCINAQWMNKLRASFFYSAGLSVFINNASIFKSSKIRAGFRSRVCKLSPNVIVIFSMRKVPRIQSWVTHLLRLIFWALYSVCSDHLCVVHEALNINETHKKKKNNNNAGYKIL